MPSYKSPTNHEHTSILAFNQQAEASFFKAYNEAASKGPLQAKEFIRKGREPMNNNPSI